MFRTIFFFFFLSHFKRRPALLLGLYLYLVSASPLEVVGGKGNRFYFFCLFHNSEFPIEFLFKLSKLTLITDKERKFVKVKKWENY